MNEGKAWAAGVIVDTATSWWLAAPSVPLASTPTVYWAA